MFRQPCGCQWLDDLTVDRCPFHRGVIAFLAHAYEGGLDKAFKLEYSLKGQPPTLFPNGGQQQQTANLPSSVDFKDGEAGTTRKGVDYGSLEEPPGT